MESVILIAISAFALYYLSLKQDYMANLMFAEAFERFERRYNNVTYTCQDSTVVKKKLFSFPNLPCIPSVNFSVRALCLTENNEWFWFDASIRLMKVHSTCITPVTNEEASEALKDDPECFSRYFSDKEPANHT
ncbi:hypothetical protein GZ77_04300 [Endozoicomonas montiporae]|uniref:Uncharacterized protein n=2 Tax=Endozoicomonas montiporae TaxID=1027273 RepID=A0A081NBF3_9GAMM|nr:hypothetical protein [Endozoicomonas montiporae]AMO56053.1 hypothetical protein EZMO1_1914 [Endozoicomonas montiporae CL-33]KEQ15776.1 hypothetical protein GZ77_04300 [Endozoicomonas montiporae]